jgi:hypothetical protein
LKQQIAGDLSYISGSIHAFGVIFVYNLIDWLILDWLIFCTITPGFLVIPGTEGMVEYKDYKFHFRGFLVGTGLSIFAGLIIGALVLLL